MSLVRYRHNHKSLVGTREGAGERSRTIGRAIVNYDARPGKKRLALDRLESRGNELFSVKRCDDDSYRFGSHPRRTSSLTLSAPKAMVLMHNCRARFI
jgi:hypothetical protein